MANKKIVDFTALTAPASNDVLEIVDVSDTTDAASGSSRQVSPANLITKAHGLSDGIAKVSSSVMTTITAPTGTIVGTSDSQALTNKTLDNTNTITVKDANFTIQDDADTTKQAVIQASGITTGTTRTITLPDASGTATLLGNASTGSGSVVLATSPTLVTPALGTPSALVATNATGTATGLTSGITQALKSATTTVDVSAATAPTSGQVLTATGGTAATWQTPAGGGGGGLPTSTDAAVFSYALTSDSGFTGDGTQRLLRFYTVTFDPASTANGSGQFVAPATGYYRFNIQVRFDQTGCQPFLKVGSSIVKWGEITTSGNLIAALVGTVSLTSGDVVSVYTSGFPTNYNALATTAATWFEGSRIS